MEAHEEGHTQNSEQILLTTLTNVQRINIA